VAQLSGEISLRFDLTSSTFVSAAVFVSASAWGLYWIPLRHLEGQGLEGAWPVTALNIPGALMLALIVLYRWERNRSHMRRARLIGLFTGLAFAFYATGLLFSSVVRVTLFYYLTPIWATLIGMLWLGERASLPRWLAIGVGLLGLALLVSGGGSMPLNIGDLFGVLSGISWAIGGALIMRFGTVPLEGSTMAQLTVTGIAAVVLGAITLGPTLPSAEAFVAAIPLSVFVSLVVLIPSIWVIFWASKILFPSRVGLLMMTEVLVAVLTAALFLPDETMSLREWAGAILILSACLIEVLFSPGKEKVQA
jgi:drug/metabolite transporter (DMT)-like permease